MLKVVRRKVGWMIVLADLAATTSQFSKSKEGIEDSPK